MKVSYPLTVKINLTKKFNLRCKHCFLKDFNKSIDINTFKKIIDDFIENKMKSVVLTGGEVFLLKDIFKMLIYLKENKINFSIASNGTLITERKAEKLKQINIKYIQISLDGHNKRINDSIRGSNSFASAIRGIKNLLKYKIDVVIGHVIHKQNYIYLEKFIKFCIRLKITKIRFELYVPVNSNEPFKDKLTLDVCDVKKIYNKIMLLKTKYKNIKFFLPIFNTSYGCGAGIFNAIINPNLTMSPCDLYSEIIYSEKISKDLTIKKIWNDSKTFKDWRDVMTSSCSNNCNIGCRASAKSYTNDLKGVDPINMINFENGEN